VIPYADFTYFVLLLYVAVPTVILGLFGRAGWRWALLVTTLMSSSSIQDVLHCERISQCAKSGSYWRSPCGNG